MKDFKHGTQTGYKIKKCRCQDCVLWHTMEMMIYRHNRTLRGERLVEGKWVMVQD